MSFFLTVFLEPGLPEDTRLLHRAQGQAAGKLWPANAFALLPVQVPQTASVPHLASGCFQRYVLS